MKNKYSLVATALALALAFAAPLQAQEADVAKSDGEAAKTEMMKSHNEMMTGGEGCQCSCMKGMHGKTMEAHGDAEGRAEGMAHAEVEGQAQGMDMEEGHAGMMAGCKCMSGDAAEGGHAMSCKMHGKSKEAGTKAEPESDS